MVLLMFKNLDIPEGFKHIASDWQVSKEDKYFRDENIVAQSKNDKKHLTSILFNIDLDPDKKYYARARVIMDYGPSDWSDIDIIRTKDIDKINLDIDIPGAVAKPGINIDFPANSVPPTMFTITTTPISINSNAKHASTDYIITDITGNIMYTNLEDTSDLTSHRVSNVILPDNNFYLVKVAHRTTSGDVSPFGQKLIYVPGNNIVKVKSTLTPEDASQRGLTVELEHVNDIRYVYVNLYMVGADEPVVTYHKTEDKFIFDIPASAFKNPIGTYLLSLQYEYINGRKTNIKYFKLIAS